MKITKVNPILALVNDYLIDSPAATNLSYFWNYGSLLGLNLIILIVSGLTLAMHYTPNTLMAFNSVEHIIRDVNNGWLIRSLHANGASFFFILVYLHIGRGLFYGSYRNPRGLLWTIGVIIFILMMATAFIGYVLPWGLFEAPNDLLRLGYFYSSGRPKVPTEQRIGPRNIDILSVLVGNLLGDAHGELRSGSPRFSFHMSSVNRTYLLWLHEFYAIRGYCSHTIPIFKPQTGKDGSIYYSAKFNTFTFGSLKWLYDMFYQDRVKIMPKTSLNL